jgi:hypothetical protein
MKNALPSALLAAALLAASLQRSDACGSSAWTLYPALAPAQTSLNYITDPSSWSGGWDVLDRDEYRLLYPAAKTHPKQLQLLWGFSYGFSPTKPGYTEPDFTKEQPVGGWGAPEISLPTGALQVALAAGDLQRASLAARSIVEAYLALPPVMAVQADSSLSMAVEVLELAPLLIGVSPSELLQYLPSVAPEGPGPELFNCLATRSTWSTLPAPTATATTNKAARPKEPAPLPESPGWCRARSASVGILELKQRSAREIPNGWPSDTDHGASVAPLLELSGQWLKSNPDHPMRDWVRLWEVRLQHFAQESSDSWAVFAELYPRRPVRVLAELRYLLLTQGWPESAVIDAFPHPEVVVGLLTQEVIASRPERQAYWWRWAAEHRSQPWAVNLQERLLTALTRDPDAASKPLPDWFPTRAEVPSPLWGKLRAGLLLIRGRLLEAERQAQLVAPDGEQASLLASARLRQNRPLAAVLTPFLDVPSRNVILRGWLDETALRNLLTHPDKSLSTAARLELSTRRMAEQDFASAANLLRQEDPDRAARFDEAARLNTARETLALARLLAADFQMLSHSVDRGDYRGLSDLYRRGTRQGTHLEAAVTRADERWLALSLFTRWLEANSKSPEAGAVLAETDALYNQLINWGGGPYFWGDYAPRSVLIRRLRAAGKAVKRAASETEPPSMLP